MLIFINASKLLVYGIFAIDQINTLKNSTNFNKNKQNVNLFCALCRFKRAEQRGVNNNEKNVKGREPVLFPSKSARLS